MVQARIAISSQIPKDFFSGALSAKSTIYKTSSNSTFVCGDDKHIFEEFKKMFKMRKNLKRLAMKLGPKKYDMDFSVP